MERLSDCVHVLVFHNLRVLGVLSDLCVADATLVVGLRRKFPRHLVLYRSETRFMRWTSLASLAGLSVFLNGIAAFEIMAACNKMCPTPFPFRTCRTGTRSGVFLFFFLKKGVR